VRWREGSSRWPCASWSSAASLRAASGPWRPPRMRRLPPRGGCGHACGRRPGCGDERVPGIHRLELTVPSRRGCGGCGDERVPARETKADARSGDGGVGRVRRRRRGRELRGWRRGELHELGAPQRGLRTRRAGRPHASKAGARDLRGAMEAHGVWKAPWKPPLSSPTQTRVVSSASKRS
jgi:hypothetical protein